MARKRHSDEDTLKLLRETGVHLAVTCRRRAGLRVSAMRFVPRSSRCSVFRDNVAIADRHRYVAQAVQPHRPHQALDMRAQCPKRFINRQ
jgi:hypothetical protein